MIFSQSEKQLIEAAVKAAEKGNTGEIVPVVVPASGDYGRVSFRLGLFGFSLAALVTVWMHWQYPFVDYFFLLGILILGGFLGWLTGRIPAMIRLFIGEKKMAAEVHEAAFAAFSRNGLHHTKNGTGILIFVSLLEHRVEILADRGIHAKVGDDFWKIEMQKLILGIREKRASETLSEVIRDMGIRLQEHFPAAAGDRNELSDELRSR